MVQTRQIIAPGSSAIQHVQRVGDTLYIMRKDGMYKYSLQTNQWEKFIGPVSRKSKKEPSRYLVDLLEALL